MNIPIKKHTKVRRPMSRWKITLRENDEIGIVLRGAYTPLVKDITQNLVKYPLDTTYTQPLNVWSEWGEWTPEMVKMIDNIKLPKNSDITFFSTPKPSLLTRVKERFKR